MIPLDELTTTIIIRVSAGLSLSQQYYSAVIPGLKLDQIPYNENVTVGISAVNCIDESEEVNISFVI